MLCPSCQVDLHMSERQGVEIDYCPKCRGVWLDRGELDKILERSRQELAVGPGMGPGAGQPPARAPPPPGQGHPSHHGHDDRHDKRRRKRNFLEEFFD